ncbi:MAG: DUF4838 domain-containing protein, partial [Verrucomicrobiota bacterium]|nr:DUF4838 domain-containing protein [Verrucomicrobiota bacterium]
MNKEIKINPAKCTIVLPKGADGVKSFAAEELKKHLKLITGLSIPIIVNDEKKTEEVFCFMVGIPSPYDADCLRKEEAKYIVTDNMAYIYGEDKINSSNKSAQKVSTQMKYNRTGTLFAVYAFLENEFGIKWLEPGDKGIVYKPSRTLTLRENNYNWTPKLSKRAIRSNSWRWKYVKNRQKSLPVSMRISQSEAEKHAMNELIWLKRMRMGRNLILNYGHAFTKHWEKYGKSHPEYFAMSPDGKRYPYANAGKPDRVKICPSSEALQNKVVEDWSRRYDKDPERNKTINVCENDSGGYCHCAECLKLDAPLEKNEKFGEFMTDRYLHFANEVLKKARKKDSEVKTVMYAYSVYRYPPRKTKVADGVVLGFVPRLMQPLKELDGNYKKWGNAGAKEMFL